MFLGSFIHLKHKGSIEERGVSLLSQKHYQPEIIGLAGRDSKVYWKSVIMFQKKLELLKPIWNESEGEKTTHFSTEL